jgi:hypothetical protein
MPRCVCSHFMWADMLMACRFSLSSPKIKIHACLLVIPRECYSQRLNIFQCALHVIARFSRSGVSDTSHGRHVPAAPPHVFSSPLFECFMHLFCTCYAPVRSALLTKRHRLTLTLCPSVAVDLAQAGCYGISTIVSLSLWI